MARRRDDPQADLDLERRILGACLAYRGEFLEHNDQGVEAEWFFRHGHRTLWNRLQAMSSEGVDIDLVSVSAALVRHGEMDDVGGPSYLAGMLDDTVKPSASSRLHNIECLIEHSSRRDLEAAGVDLREAVQKGSADEALTEHLEKVEIIRSRGLRASQWLTVDEQVAAYITERKRASDGVVGFYIQSLDSQIGAQAPGEVCGLMARPGMGKTIVLSWQALHNAGAYGWVFFSLEMPAAQITGRMLQMAMGLSRNDLERATQLDDYSLQPYRDAARYLVIVDTAGLSVTQMSNVLRQIQNGPLRDVPVRGVTIDHLGLIGGDRSLSTYDRVSHQVREVKELAKRHNVAVTLAIQVNRDAGGDGSKELHLGSARDSGVVEEAVDYLIGMRRFDRSTNYSLEVRQQYKDVLFARAIKVRHESPADKEVAFKYDWCLELEDRGHIETPKASGDALNFGGRRR